MKKMLLAAAAVSCVYFNPASAAPFDYIRIGDKDGFGFTSTTGLVRATPSPHTTPSDTNGNGLLEQSEYLPDLNENGTTATNSGDNFDNRSAAEIANTAPVGGSGFTDTGSSGSKWTDISLSTSFTGPNFPDPAGPAVPNDAEFIYNFHIAGGDVVPGSGLFFNVLFGDYDVVPANITLTFASVPQQTIALATQASAADGLIQAASTSLQFGDVFTSDGSGGWNGYLKVDFIAPNDPYLAFDFTELSTIPIPTTVPEPASLLLLATCLAGAGLARSRSRANKTKTAR